MRYSIYLLVRLAVVQSAIFEVVAGNEVCEVNVSRPRRVGRRPVDHCGPVQVVDDTGGVRYHDDGDESEPHTGEKLGGNGTRGALKTCRQQRQLFVFNCELVTE